MIFQRSAIEIALADGNHLYFYTPYKKFSFDDKEFYYVGVRWGEVDDAGQIDAASRVAELIFTCDFTEEYPAWYCGNDKLIIYDY